jgi:hypothetical protein
MLFPGRADHYVTHCCFDALASGSFDKPATRYRDNYLAFEVDMSWRLGPSIHANESDIEFIVCFRTLKPGQGESGSSLSGVSLCCEKVILTHNSHAHI